MHDGLELETRGVPAVVVCTEPFRATAEAICAARGTRNYDFAIVEHPIGNLTDDELSQRVDAAQSAIESILTARGLIGESRV